MSGPPMRDALGREVTPGRIAELRQHIQFRSDPCSREMVLVLDTLTAENARLEGWGEATMDGCLRILVKAEAALVGVLEAVGSGRGASDLLEELSEAVRQLSAGKGT